MEGKYAKESAVAKTVVNQNHSSILRPGSRTDHDGKAVTNVVLLSIPDDEYNLFRPYLEWVDLPQYQILQEPGRKIDFTYFLNDGMASIV